jgi:hypothetical protein
VPVIPATQEADYQEFQTSLGGKVKEIPSQRERETEGESQGGREEKRKERRKEKRKSLRVNCKAKQESLYPGFYSGHPGQVTSPLYTFLSLSANICKSHTQAIGGLEIIQSSQNGAKCLTIFCFCHSTKIIFLST